MPTCHHSRAMHTLCTLSKLARVCHTPKPTGSCHASIVLHPAITSCVNGLTLLLLVWVHRLQRPHGRFNTFPSFAGQLADELQVGVGGVE